MNKYREAFEKLGDIKDILNDHDIFFNEKIGSYTANKVLGLDSVSYPHWEVTYVNGAFYSYLEQQKQINKLQARLDILSVLICGDVIDILSCVEGHGDNSQLIEELEQAFKGDKND